MPPSSPEHPTDRHADGKSVAEKASRRGGVRRAVVRGLGVVLPPLLTIVVLLWAWNAIESYVLRPVETGMQWVLVQTFADMPSEIPPTAIQNERGFTYEGVSYVPDPTGRRYLPGYVVQRVEEVPDQFGANAAPLNTARAYWQRYVSLQYLPRTVVVPVFLILFLTLLYFLGRLFAGGLGRWFVTAFDSAILRIPIVNKVYGSVKQITDFAFDDREIEFNRVVAIQYPRKGIWSLGFVTGNSLREISEAAGEPMLSVLMPTSPMPMTGFTVTVRRSEAIDLELTIDEAIQFIVSCGVVVPPQQRIGGNGEAATTPPSLQLPASTSATSVPSIDSHP